MAAPSSRYEIQRTLGQGAWGRVVLAIDTATGREVAIKVLTARQPDEETLARFQREAKAAAKLSHPHIVGIYGADVDAKGNPYIVYEYVPGHDLEKVREEELPVEPETMRRWALQTAEALAAVHEAGILHRDLKPANIMLRDGEEAVIADFGLSRLEEEATLTKTGQMPGTPLYMAPELWRGHLANTLSDQFGWAATFYDVVYREKLFDVGNLAQLQNLSRAAWKARLPAGRGEHAVLRAVLRRALEARPEDRFPDMRAVAAALRAESPAAFAPDGPDHAPTLVSSASPVGAAAPPSPGWRQPALVAGALLALGVGFFAQGGSERAAPAPTSASGEAVESAPEAAPPIATPDPDPEPDPEPELRGRVEERLSAVMESHVRESGRLLSRTDEHLDEVRDEMLDRETVRNVRLLLEAMADWVEVLTPEAIPAQPARELLRRLRNRLCHHLLREYKKLMESLGHGLGTRLLRADDPGGLARDELKQREVLRVLEIFAREVRKFLERIRVVHPEPPLHLLLLEVALVEEVLHEGVDPRLAEVQARIHASPGAQELEQLYQAQIRLQYALRDRNDFTETLVGAYRSNRVAFEKGGPLPPADFTRYLVWETTFRGWADMLGEARPPTEAQIEEAEKVLDLGPALADDEKKARRLAKTLRKALKRWGLEEAVEGHPLSGLATRVAAERQRIKER